MRAIARWIAVAGVLAVGGLTTAEAAPAGSLDAPSRTLVVPVQLPRTPPGRVEPAPPLKPPRPEIGPDRDRDRDRDRPGDGYGGRPGWGWREPYHPHYPPPYYPPPPPPGPWWGRVPDPGPVWVPGEWVWDGWGWVWRPGYWTRY